MMMLVMVMIMHLFLQVINNMEMVILDMPYFGKGSKWHSI